MHHNNNQRFGWMMIVARLTVSGACD